MPDIKDIKKNPTRVQPTIYIVQEMQNKESAMVLSQIMDEAREVIGHKTEILKVGKVTEWVTNSNTMDFWKQDKNDIIGFDYHQLATLVNNKLSEIFQYSEDNFYYVPNIIYILNEDLGIEIELENYKELQGLFGPHYLHCNVLSIALENNQNATRSLWQLNDKQGVYLADVQSLASVINGINKKMTTRLMRNVHVHTGMQGSAYNIPWDFKVYQYLLSLPGVEVQMSKEDAIKHCVKKVQSEGFSPKIGELQSADFLPIIIAWDVSKETMPYDRTINEELARVLDYIQNISKVLNHIDILVFLIRSDRVNDRVAVFEMQTSPDEVINITNIKNHKVPDVKNKEQARKHYSRKIADCVFSHIECSYLYTLTNNEDYIYESANMFKSKKKLLQQNIIWLGENQNSAGLWSCAEPGKLYKMLQTLIQRTAISAHHYYQNSNRKLITISKNSNTQTASSYKGGGNDGWPTDDESWPVVDWD